VVLDARWSTEATYPDDYRPPAEWDEHFTAVLFASSGFQLETYIATDPGPGFDVGARFAEVAPGYAVWKPVPDGGERLLSAGGAFSGQAELRSRSLVEDTLYTAPTETRPGLFETVLTLATPKSAGRPVVTLNQDETQKLLKWMGAERLTSTNLPAIGTLGNCDDPKQIHLPPTDDDGISFHVRVCCDTVDDGTWSSDPTPPRPPAPPAPTTAPTPPRPPAPPAPPVVSPPSPPSPDAGAAPPVAIDAGAPMDAGSPPPPADAGRPSSASGSSPKAASGPDAGVVAGDAPPSVVGAATPPGPAEPPSSVAAPTGSAPAARPASDHKSGLSCSTGPTGTAPASSPSLLVPVVAGVLARLQRRR
jgi:MYXO-CTERM domain-containing protein